MFRIPNPPDYAGTRKEWEDYRSLILGYPDDEPGRNGALADAEGMIDAIAKEVARLPVAA